MAADIDRLVTKIARKVELKLLEELREVPCTAPAEHCSGEGLCAVRRPDDVARIRDVGAARVGASPGIGKVRQDLAQLIDHTLLKADATHDELARLCEEARAYGFASVCVNAANVAFCKRHLAGSGVMTVAVVGFPLGASPGSAKAFEAKEAVRAGADEIDMVINLGALKSRDYATVHQDIAKVVEAVKPRPVKVILETGLLDEEQKIVACALSKAAGAAFVKTSTGFGPGGATEADIALMRRMVGQDLGVKASGGVRTQEGAEAMVRAGANRIGASASVVIVTGAKPADGAAAKPGKY
ncbi:MAG: deoxyribose-phosphate aldolase [Deltaproteobacteria bacterium]|nr:deoxyribose-phosphate aldolase [Deltaproteobacteria bacterium]